MQDLELSKNFTLKEFLESKTARLHSIYEQWDPPPGVVDNLRQLCEHLLQPLRDGLGESIIISSGWRCPRLNTLVGGVGNSWHLSGRAADCDNGNDNQKIINKVKELGLPFDQMIDEDHLNWVHLSYDNFKNRYQILKMVNGKYEIMK